MPKNTKIVAEDVQVGDFVILRGVACEVKSIDRDDSHRVTLNAVSVENGKRMTAACPLDFELSTAPLPADIVDVATRLGSKLDISHTADEENSRASTDEEEQSEEEERPMYRSTPKSARKHSRATPKKQKERREPVEPLIRVDTFSPGDNEGEFAILSRATVDIARAHLDMLRAGGVIKEPPYVNVRSILAGMHGCVFGGNIHGAVVEEVTKRAGEDADFAFAGQYSADVNHAALRMYSRERIDDLVDTIEDTTGDVLMFMKREEDTVVPLFAGNKAIGVGLAQHQLSAVLMDFERCKGQLRAVRADCNRCPLGSGIGSGITLDMDRNAIARALHFDDIIPHTFAAATDFAFVGAVLAAAKALAALAVRAHRLVSSWCAESAGAVDGYSPIHPHSLEAARLSGELATLLGFVSSTESLFLLGDTSPTHQMTTAIAQGIERVVASTQRLCIACAQLCATARVDRTCAKRAEEQHLAAFAVAEYLVKKGVPSKTANADVRTVVALAESREILLRDLKLYDLRLVNRHFDEDVYRLFTLSGAIDAIRTRMGAHPIETKKLAAAAERIHAPHAARVLLHRMIASRKVARSIITLALNDKQRGWGATVRFDVFDNVEVRDAEVPLRMNDTMHALTEIRSLLPEMTYSDLLALGAAVVIEIAAGRRVPVRTGRRDAVDDNRPRGELLDVKHVVENMISSDVHRSVAKMLDHLPGDPALTDDDGKETLSAQVYAVTIANDHCAADLAEYEKKLEQENKESDLGFLALREIATDMNAAKRELVDVFAGLL